MIDVVGGSSVPPVVPKAKKSVQKRKPELPKPDSPPVPVVIKSPEEPGEIVLSPPPIMTRPVFEDIPAQQSPPQVSQRRGFEPPPLEDRYARINRPTLIDDRHSRAFTSPDRRLSNFTTEDARSRWDDQGFEQQQRPDRRSFDQHRKFHDEPSHFPRATSTTGTSSNVSSPSPREYIPRDAYSHQQREHRFHPHDRIPQQQQHQNRSTYSHPQYPDSQRRRMFSRDEESGRGRDYDEQPSQQRTRFDDHFRGQSPPPSRRPSNTFAERRSPQHRQRPFFPPEDSQRNERNNRFINEVPPSRIRHQEDHLQPESPHTSSYPRPGTREFDRHTTNSNSNNNNDTQQQ